MRRGGVIVAIALLVAILGVEKARADSAGIPYNYLPGNIVANGSFEVLPPNAGDHGTTVKPGSTEIKGWNVVGGSVATWTAGPCGDVNLTESGGLSQNLSTVPGKMYELSFRMSGVSRGPMVKTISFRAGNVTHVFEHDTRTVQHIEDDWPTKTFDFVASATQTTIEFRSNAKDWHGPIIAAINVVPLDDATAAKRTLEPLYGSISSGIQRHSYAYIIFGLGPNFALKLKGGDTVGRSQYEAYLRQASEGKTGYSVRFRITGAAVQSGHVAAEVERTTAYTLGDHRYSVVTRLKETWTEAAPGDWKLDASEELGETVTVDGTEQKPSTP